MKLNNMNIKSGHTLNVDFIVESENIKLIPTYFSSEKEVAKLANDITIANYMGKGFPSPFSIKDAFDFNEKIRVSWKEGTHYHFSIYKKYINIKKNILVGQIGIKIDKDNNCVKNLAYWIGKDFRRFGIAEEAIKLILNVCFTLLKVTKVEAHVYEGNFASISLLNKIGFIQYDKKIKYKEDKKGNLLDCYYFSISDNTYNTPLK